MMIKIKEILIKTYNNVRKIKRYYILLCYVYEIIRDEIWDKVNLNLILQMAIKVVNNIASLNDFILTLLVFEAYSCMIEKSALSSLIIQ